MAQVTEVVKIRRRVLSEIARMTYEGTLLEDATKILQTVVTEDGPRYRCCVHKERAVLKDRIKLALSQPTTLPLSEAITKALNKEMADLPILDVMPVACDGCPIDKYIITDGCRNCVAHNCMASCGKDAITIHQNRAYIDKSKCVECGMCARACQYHAIIEVTRPCERACDIRAIKAGNNRIAQINHDLCAQCGSCKVACPFGAITDRSMIVQVIQHLKEGSRVVAMLAPAFIGQFGPKVRPAQVMKALDMLGFHEVYEASYGADIVTVEETQEFIDSVVENKERPFMTTSCCPAFVNMVEKQLPDLKGNVSSTVSPMIATGRIIKAQDPEAIVVFIGPCIAKKVEGRRYSETIDYVLTFEEVASMMVGKGINVATLDDSDYISTGSRDGNNFARAGGVLQAVLDAAKHVEADSAIKAQHCEGLGNCKVTMLQMKAGKTDLNFMEGMACVGGCVGGPGALSDYRVTGKLVENFAKTAPVDISPANQSAMEKREHISFHHHHES